MTAARSKRVAALIERNKAGIINRTGQTSGIQVVESYSHHDGKWHYWTVLCGCGSRRAVRASNLCKKFGHSCGCMTREILAEAQRSHGQSNGAGRLGSRAYRCWRGMWERCTLSRRSDWMQYGGRGITVCDRWKRFENFFADMGMAGEGLTLDRIDSDGNYEPTNCRWATAKEQANNRRNNVSLTYRGETKTLSQWAEVLGIYPDTLVKRIKSGMDESRAFTPGSLRVTSASRPTRIAEYSLAREVA